MGQTFINGAKYSFSTSLADPVAITAITNDNPAVASALVVPNDGDIVLLQSNWTDLSDMAAYVDNAGAGGFELAGVDTSDTSLYFEDEELPATYQVAGDFVSLSQIRSIDQTGGDTNSFTWGYIDDRSMRQRSRPTDQNPLILTFTMDFDPDLPWDAALEQITRTRQMTTMRERLPTGDVLLYTGYLSYQKSPTRVRNENMTVSATMSINSEILRYPASFFAGS